MTDEELQAFLATVPKKAPVLYKKRLEAMQKSGNQEALNAISVMDSIERPIETEDEADVICKKVATTLLKWMNSDIAAAKKAIRGAAFYRVSTAFQKYDELGRMRTRITNEADNIAISDCISLPEVEEEERRIAEDSAKLATLEDETENKKKEQEKQEYRGQNSNAAYLQGFLGGIKDSVNTPVISTGYKLLDEALDGGLYEGLYIIGAISSLGKTTYIAQMADQIAQAGHDIIYISLEMARNEIISKSISRHTIEKVIETGGDVRTAKTARGITDGKRWTNYSIAEHELIQSAIRRYSEYAEHFFITEGIGNIGVSQVCSIVQEHIEKTGERPVLIIDYMQILAPVDPRATDKQNTDKNVIELKRMSRDFKIPVIAISSFNRMSYSGEVTMAAFKESGAIEYSADVLLGMQLQGTGEHGFDEDNEKGKNPRSIEVKILKYRNGATGAKIQYDYYTVFNFFKEKKLIKPDHGNIWTLQTIDNPETESKKYKTR